MKVMEEIFELSCIYIYWNIVLNLMVIIIKILDLLILNKLLKSFIISLAFVYYIYSILSKTRYQIFEIIHKNKDYVTPRKKKDKLPNVTKRDYIMSIIWGFFLTFFFYQKKYNILIIDFKDNIILLILFLVTDLIYYIYHRIMHINIFYKLFHKLHHRTNKPTSFENCELIGYFDGTCLFLIPILTIFIIKYFIYISNEIQLLSIIQWFIVGQLQHGGKDIELNEIIFLKIITKLFGVKNSMSLQHDIHHTKFNYNYSLSGIYDKIFGTQLE